MRYEHVLDKTLFPREIVGKNIINWASLVKSIHIIPLQWTISEVSCMTLYKDNLYVAIMQKDPTDLAKCLAGTGVKFTPEDFRALVQRWYCRVHAEPSEILQSWV